MMIDTSIKAKKLVSYKTVDEKLILNMKSKSILIKCSNRFGKNWKLLWSYHIIVFRALENGNLLELSLKINITGIILTQIKSMYASDYLVFRPKRFIYVVGWQIIDKIKALKQLYRQKWENKDFSEAD